MRHFNWRDFKRKGERKQELKELKLLKENLQDIKSEVLTRRTKGFRDLAKEIHS